MIKKTILFFSFFFLLFIVTIKVAVVQAQDVLNNVASNASPSSLPAIRPSITPKKIDPSKIKQAGERFGSFVTRIEAINNKINSRITKIKKTKAKINNITLKYANIVRQTQILRKDLASLNKLSVGLGRSKNLKTDYEKYRNLLTGALTKMQVITVAQKDILTEMSKVPTISATPTTVVKK